MTEETKPVEEEVIAAGEECGCGDDCSCDDDCGCGGEDAGAQMPELKVEDLLMWTLGEYARMAWMNLGIQTNPATGETTADFPQARLAIDCINALVPVLEGKLEAHVLRDLKNMLSSLQMNYAQRYNAEAK